MARRRYFVKQGNLLSREQGAPSCAPRVAVDDQGRRRRRREIDFVAIDRYICTGERAVGIGISVGFVSVKVRTGIFIDSCL